MGSCAHQAAAIPRRQHDVRSPPCRTTLLETQVCCMRLLPPVLHSTAADSRQVEIHTTARQAQLLPVMVRALTFDHCSISSAERQVPTPPPLGLLEDCGLLQLVLLRLSILFLKSAVSLPVVVFRCRALLKLSTCGPTTAQSPSLV